MSEDIIVHNGYKIPTAPPKDTDGIVWYGFDYPLESGESIISSAWLINNTPVSEPDTVIDGLKFKLKATADNITKVQLAEGINNRVYTLTNRISTNKVPSNDYSFYMKVTKL